MQNMIHIYRDEPGYYSIILFIHRKNSCSYEIPLNQKLH